MAKTQSAHPTVRSLASSIRSSTLSILFRISARAPGRGPRGAQRGSSWVADPPKGSAAAGAVAGGEGRAGGQGGQGWRLGELSRRDFSFFFLFGFFFFESGNVPESNQPLCSALCSPTSPCAARGRLPCGSKSSGWVPLGSVSDVRSRTDGPRMRG
jgi:hypothetical protein